MASNNTEVDYDYNERSPQTETPIEDTLLLKNIRMLYIIGYLVICGLGVTLNLYVIIVVCRVCHKKPPPTSVWILALAVTHVIFSAFLVLQFLYAWHHFNWRYGASLCKISSFVIYSSMFSTAAMLSMWSISRCICSSNFCEAICGPICGRGTSMIMILVSSSWTFGVLLGLPSLFSRELRYTNIGEQCIDDFDYDDNIATDIGWKYLMAVVLSRFLLGVLLPMFLILISACLEGRQNHDLHQNCKRIMCAIKVAYFICWTPLLFMGLVQVTSGNNTFFKYGLPAATVLAAAHSLVNPVIYLLVGRRINMGWMLLNYN
ncbi:chemerin-like receptor 1 [Hoplias malabaricus]|uniref:chemerin-like receptor 1 n=1 Tax=Hoplias malabaricus TaxID=27720 RepID=UPI003462DE9B